jgi:membrane associated rhomboid family serine protease
MSDGEVLVRQAGDRRRADEWSLVLSSQEIENAIRRAPEGFAVFVDRADLGAALRSLDAYEQENPAAPAPPEEAQDRIGELDRFVGGALGALMLAFFVVTGPRNPEVVWFAEGSADAARILGGELWRTVTALCLHADLGHVVSNALFGALFVSAVCAGLGPGVGVALTLAAGATGNLANAIFQGPDHVSVGASTAVFGAVGLLGGRGVAQRIRRGELGFRIWVPIAAGLALIAMLGTGERSDIWAHGFGFLAGGFLGVPASLAWPHPADRSLQWSALALTVVALLQAWRLALV